VGERSNRELQQAATPVYTQTGGLQNSDK